MFSFGSSRFFESGGCLLISATRVTLRWGGAGCVKPVQSLDGPIHYSPPDPAPDQVGFSVLAHLRRVERPPHESLLPIRI
jgi:hypothetical protein